MLAGDYSRKHGLTPAYSVNRILNLLGYSDATPDTHGLRERALKMMSS